MGRFSFTQLVKSVDLNHLKIYWEFILYCIFTFIVALIVQDNASLVYDECIFGSEKGSDIPEDTRSQRSLSPHLVVFAQERVKYPIFNVKHNNTISGPYCTLGMFSESDEFLTNYLKLGMKGINFFDIKLV